MGFGTALSGGFPCGFNTVGRLGPLHEVGQAVGLRGHKESSSCWNCYNTTTYLTCLFDKP